MRAMALFLLAAFAAAPGLAAEFTIHGFSEVVANVRDAGSVAGSLEDAAGWEVRDRRVVDRAQLDAWQLDTPTSGQQWLLAAPGAQRGFLRLVQFENVAQQRIRPHDQPWDTGGLFDVNVHTTDLDVFYQAIDPFQWHAASEPLHLEAFGHSQWLPRGPDGLRLSPIERKEDVRDKFPELAEARLSRAFNATQVVRDIEGAVAFYRDVLGFQVVLESPQTRLGAGPNVFGLPFDVVGEITLPFAVLSPDGSGEGTLELIAFDGVSGRDFSGNAHPPNLGMLILRFPVEGIQALERHLRLAGAEILFPVSKIPLPPHGVVDLLAVRGPEGLWLEFFE